MRAKLHWVHENKTIVSDFKTQLPSHEAGLIELMAQITSFAWARGIHHFKRIDIIGEDTTLKRASDEALKRNKRR